VLSVTAEPTLADTLCTLVPVDGHYTRQRVLRNQSQGLADRREIRRGSRFPYSPQSVAWSGKLWRDSASKPPIVRNPSHGAAGCGEIRRGSRLPCSPQSVAWSGKPWRDSASKSSIVRNLSHGLARGDCRRCVDDRRRAYVMDNHGGLTPPLLAVHAFVHRKSRHFTCRDSCIQAGAAGVSPPWCAETHLQGR
jgi:hypothetical protein